MIFAKEYLQDKNINFSELLIAPGATIEDALVQINRISLGALLIVGVDNNLLGLITDGDIRRAIIRHIPLTDTCNTIIDKSPVTVLEGEEETANYLFDSNDKGIHINHIPVVNTKNQLIDLLLNVSYVGQKRQNPIVIMAGGLGSRLGALTEDCPKPMLNIYDKPLLEILVDKFRKDGFGRFYFSINYKADVIKNYFRDGKKFGVTINYLHENKRLGTAGALSLIKNEPTLPIIVMNGDVITNVNFRALLSFHKQMNTKMTICTIKRSTTIPYGVVQTSGHLLTEIREKPKNDYYINAGIYVINAEVLKIIPKDSYFDMTDLIEQLTPQKEVSVFPIHEYWVDIGYVEDLERAKNDRRVAHELV